MGILTRPLYRVAPDVFADLIAREEPPIGSVHSQKIVRLGQEFRGELA
jgi:hypothetical protein